MSRRVPLWRRRFFVTPRTMRYRRVAAALTDEKMAVGEMAIAVACPQLAERGAEKKVTAPHGALDAVAPCPRL